MTFNNCSDGVSTLGSDLQQEWYSRETFPFTPMEKRLQMLQGFLPQSRLGLGSGCTGAWKTYLGKNHYPTVNI